jgi:rhomboid protease GluP
MKDFNLKIKYILIPYIKITFATTLIYLIFYVICINLLELKIKDNLANFIIPGGMAVIAVHFWLRRVLKMLTFKNEKNNDFYYILPMGLITWFMIVSANWVSAITNPIIHINTADEISKKPKTIYYKISTLQTDSTTTSHTYTVTRSGKNNQNTDFDVYFVAEIITKNNKESSYWVSKQYHKVEQSSKSEAVLQNIFSDYMRFAEKDFKSEQYLHSAYFERLKHSEEKIRATEAILKIKPGIDKNKLVILAPEDEDVTQKSNTYLNYIFISLFGGIGGMMFILIFPGFKLQQKKKRSFSISGIFTCFSKESFQSITFIIIGINIAVFIVLLFCDVDILSPTARDLLNLGAVNKDELVKGHIWRIFTSMFIHAGIVHLINNMVGLVITGLILESYMSKLQYILLYTLSGIAGCLVSLAVNPNSVLVGASGAIFGLYGAGIVAGLILKNRLILISSAVLGGISLFMGLITPGVSNAAHIGGLICGAVIFYLMKDIVENRLNETPQKPL